MIENPQPAWLPLLLLTLPGIVFAACALNEIVFPREDRPLCTIPAIGMVLALLPTHVLALALGSLSLGLTLAWSMVGVVGYAWIARHWRAFFATVLIERAGWTRKFGIAAAATLPIVLPTILLNFHDEGYFNAHQAIIAHLQNGTYPPRYLYEPNLPLRYHYAFDLAGAIVTGLLRVRLDQAIDLLTLVLWPCMFLLLWRVGEHIGGGRAGLFVAVTVCFSGGFLGLAQTVSGCGQCTVNELQIVPPFISYFFQHPWSIGAPIFCLIILQRAALPRLHNQLPGTAALVCSLTLLSLSEMALFVASVVALALTEAWIFVRFRERTSATVITALGGSLIGARGIGGFFVAASYPPAGGFFGTGFYLRDYSGSDAFLGQIQWNLASFGVLLVLGIVGLRQLRTEKLLLTIFVAVILATVNFLRYRDTSEINKFGAVGLIVLAMAAGVNLSGLASGTTTFARRITGVLLLTILLVPGVRFAVAVLFAYDERLAFSDQMIRPYFSNAYPVSRDEALAVSFLRTHMGPSEIVYRTVERSEPYAIWGGLPT